jgi:hypothetical protein
MSPLRLDMQFSTARFAPLAEQGSRLRESLWTPARRA